MRNILYWAARVTLILAMAFVGGIGLWKITFLLALRYDQTHRPFYDHSASGVGFVAIPIAHGMFAIGLVGGGVLMNGIYILLEKFCAVLNTVQSLQTKRPLHVQKSFGRCFTISGTAACGGILMMVVTTLASVLLSVESGLAQSSRWNITLNQYQFLSLAGFLLGIGLGAWIAKREFSKREIAES